MSNTVTDQTPVSTLLEHWRKFWDMHDQRNGTIRQDHHQLEQRFFELIDQVQREAVADHLADYADDIDYRYDTRRLGIWDGGYAQARRSIAVMTRRRAQQIRAGHRSLSNSPKANR